MAGPRLSVVTSMCRSMLLGNRGCDPYRAYCQEKRGNRKSSREALQATFPLRPEFTTERRSIGNPARLVLVRRLKSIPPPLPSIVRLSVCGLQI